MKRERINVLRAQWNKGCEDWLLTLLNMWGLQSYAGRWIEVGELYDYDGAWTMEMRDIIYCVENEVDIKRMLDWQEYCSWAAEFGFDCPTLREWIGGKRKVVSQDVRERLTKMKQGLIDLCEEEKKKLTAQRNG